MQFDFSLQIYDLDLAIFWLSSSVFLRSYPTILASSIRSVQSDNTFSSVEPVTSGLISAKNLEIPYS